MKITSLGDLFLGGFLHGHKADEVITPGVKKALESSDLVIANLESPLVDNEEILFYSLPFPKKLIQRASSDMAVFLKESNIGYVSLANNHFFDCGEEGVISTLSSLEKYGILHSGGGRDLQEALKPAVFNHKGKKVFIFSFCEINPEYLKLIKPATANEYGVCPLNHRMLHEAKSISCDADIRICCIHWGREHIYFPSPEQIDLAREILGLGFHIILGNHAHLPQKVQKSDQGIVAYSHGNFIFDSFTYEPPAVFLLGGAGDVKNETFDLPCPVKERTMKKWSRENRESVMLSIEIDDEKRISDFDVQYVFFDDKNKTVDFLDSKRTSHIQEWLSKDYIYENEKKIWEDSNRKRMLRQVRFSCYPPFCHLRMLDAFLLRFPFYSKFVRKIIQKTFMFFKR